MTDLSAYAAPTDLDDVEIIDFTLPRKFIGFRIDDDVFYANAVVGAVMLQNFVKLSRELANLMSVEGDESINFTPLVTLFNKVLTPDTAPRFVERLMSGGPDALDIKLQVLPIIQSVLEKVGLRPTPASLD